MTVCRLCGVEIQRADFFDYLVQATFADGRERVSEAWIDEEWLVCAPRISKRIWHQPVLETTDEMLNSLRSIEADLR